MEQLIECIPNFSEGRNQQTLDSIAQAIQSVKGVKLLHQDSGRAANRTVFTFAGQAESVIEAAFRAAEVAVSEIDMRQQQGEHPRIGALDVCPFVPLNGITVEELLPKVNAFSRRLYNELNIPVFLYEESAQSEVRKNLATHRIGEYEGLAQRINEGSWLPDFGHAFNPRTGGTVCGVRNFLLAYNINLKTDDLKIGKMIAYCLRASGWPKSLIEKEEAKWALGLEAVKSIGWYIEDFNKVQVSVNLTNFKQTPLWKVHESCRELALKFGTEVTGAELIGLIPQEALLDCGKHYHSNAQNATDKELISIAIERLGLNELEEFNVEKRVLEYLL